MKRHCRHSRGQVEQGQLSFIKNSPVSRGRPRSPGAGRCLTLQEPPPAALAHVDVVVVVAEQSHHRRVPVAALAQRPGDRAGRRSPRTSMPDSVTRCQTVGPDNAADTLSTSQHIENDIRFSQLGQPYGRIPRITREDPGMSENLRLVFSKPPEGLSGDEYNRWIEEAATFVDVDQLCLSSAVRFLLHAGDNSLSGAGPGDPCRRPRAGTAGGVRRRPGGSGRGARRSVPARRTPAGSLRELGQGA